MKVIGRLSLHSNRWCNDVNIGSKQFLIAVGSYVATNPLRPWTAFQ